MKGYNFEFAVSAEISVKVLKEMVKRVVEEQTGRKVRDIQFKSSMVSRGYHDEGGLPELTGCTVFFQEPNSST